jgi:hypothetical protein
MIIKMIQYTTKTEQRFVCTETYFKTEFGEFHFHQLHKRGTTGDAIGEGLWFQAWMVDNYFDCSINACIKQDPSII